jgi:nucleotide-binding universal stress UspA family protein
MATTLRITIGACSDSAVSACPTVLTWPTETRNGDATRAILTAARDADCDLSVTRARAIGGSGGPILATLSRVVISGARCSTLVVADIRATASNGDRR